MHFGRADCSRPCLIFKWNFLSISFFFSSKIDFQVRKKLRLNYIEREYVNWSMVQRSTVGVAGVKYGNERKGYMTRCKQIYQWHEIGCISQVSFLCILILVYVAAGKYLHCQYKIAVENTYRLYTFMFSSDDFAKYKINSSSEKGKTFIHSVTYSFVIDIFSNQAL